MDYWMQHIAEKQIQIPPVYRHDMMLLRFQIFLSETVWTGRNSRPGNLKYYYQPIVNQNKSWKGYPAHFHLPCSPDHSAHLLREDRRIQWYILLLKRTWSWVHLVFPVFPRDEARPGSFPVQLSSFRQQKPAIWNPACHFQESTSPPHNYWHETSRYILQHQACVIAQFLKAL